MQISVTTTKRKIFDSNGSCESEPITPISPTGSSIKINYQRTLKTLSIESSGEKSPKSMSTITPKARAKRPIEKIIRKSLTSDIEKVTGGTFSQPSEPQGVATPMRATMKKHSLPNASSTPKFSTAFSKKEPEFLTPKISNKVKERWSVNTGSFEEVTEQIVLLPRLSEQKKKGKEGQSPKSLTSLPELKYESKSPTNKKDSLKVRSETCIGSDTALEDTQSVRQPFVGGMSPPGRKSLLHPIKETKQEIDKYLSDNGEEKGLKIGKRNSQPKKANSFRHLVFGPHIEKGAFRKHLLMVHGGLIYATQFLKGPSAKFLEQKQILLADGTLAKSGKTLLLDLDETLIKCCMDEEDVDKAVYAKNPDGQPLKIPFKIRPFLTQFLKTMKNYFEIVLFTASAKHYAQAIIESIDPDKTISYILDRSYCLETKNGYCIKDLRIIKNRDLKNMIIVDNLVQSFGLQLENGIPILEWNGEKEDQELKYLTDYLIKASYEDDLREFNCEQLKLKELADASLPHILLQNWK